MNDCIWSEETERLYAKKLLVYIQEKTRIPGMISAKEFIAKLVAFKGNATSDNSLFYKDLQGGNEFLQVRMADIFSTAREFAPMPVTEIETLLDSKYYEVRMGAVSIMDFMARDKNTGPEIRQALFELYINRHDCINNWDLVDRSAPYVVGGYLVDKDRAILYQLARSKNPLERRTAIVSTYFFIRQNDLHDTFTIADLLIHDKDELVSKPVGSWIREAGKKDPKRLLDFLEKYAPTMPRVTLRYAVEKLDKKQREHFLAASNKL